MRKASIVLLAVLLIFVNTYKVNADEFNLEAMSQDQCMMTMQSIGNATIMLNKQIIQDNQAYFTTSAYESVINFIEYETKTGSMGYSVVDANYPDNSSTGDDVFMMNYKVGVEEGHNLLYLLEFHINADGKIYGFNAWEY